MKITNLNNAHRGNNKYGKTVRGSEPVLSYKRASGGEDFLEISDEAFRLYTESRVLNFEEGRRKKEAREAVISAGDLITRDKNSAARIIDMINTNNYDFNNAEIISETAERVIGFFR